MERRSIRYWGLNIEQLVRAIRSFSIECNVSNDSGKEARTSCALFVVVVGNLTRNAKASNSPHQLLNTETNSVSIEIGACERGNGRQKSYVQNASLWRRKIFGKKLSLGPRRRQEWLATLCAHKKLLGRGLERVCCRENKVFLVNTGLMPTPLGVGKL